MDKEQIYVTRQGLQKLKDELHELETNKRFQVAAYVQAAREGGDVAESAAFEDAKHIQAMVEGRIALLKATIQRAQLIGQPALSNGVCLGSKVTLLFEGDDAPETYRLVGSAEADPAAGYISNESPLGQALLGRQNGDAVVYQSPQGEVQLKIVAIC